MSETATGDAQEQGFEKWARKRWRGLIAIGTGVAIALFVALLGLIVAGAELPGMADEAFAIWVYVTGILIGILALLGYWMHRLFLGVLITDNNVMSASRAQAVLWLLAILSTYVTLKVLNIVDANSDDAVDIGRGVLLTTVAASGSVVGAQVINAPKAVKEVKEETLAKVQPTLTASHAERQGALWRNLEPKDARLKDILEGDEIVDGAAVDAGKAQMLLVTIVLIFVFLLDFFQGLSADAAATGVPVIEESVAGLLAVSHGGYLGNKLPHRTADK